MSIAVILDGCILVALLAAIIYSVRLSRQMSKLRLEKNEINAMIQNLSTAVNRADLAVQNMKEAAIESGDNLQDQITRARTLFDELEIMNEAGNSLASRLEKLAEESRKAVNEEVESGSNKVSGKKKGEASPSRSEKELMEAMEKNKKKGGA